MRAIGISVLVVDDEKVICEGMANRLTHIGFKGMDQVDWKLSGSEALALIRKNPYTRRLIFVDINMPDMDGLSFIRTVREVTSNAHFIILTAHGDFAYIQEALRLGVDDYLLKPVLLEDLKKIVEQSIEKIVFQESRGNKLMSALDGLAYGIAAGLAQTAESDPAMGKWPVYNIGQLGAALPMDLITEEEYAILPFQQGRAFLLGRRPQVSVAEILEKMLPRKLTDTGGVSKDGVIGELPELYEQASKLINVSRFFPLMGIVFASSYGSPETHLLDLTTADKLALEKTLRTFDKENFLKILNRIFPDRLPSSVYFSDIGRFYAYILRAMDSAAFTFSLEISRPFENAGDFQNVDELKAALLRAFDALSGAFAENLGRFTMEDSLRYISANLSSVDLATVANYSDLSYTYFSQLFKRSTGKNFTRYMTDLKMKTALQMIRNGVKVSEAAARLGYNNAKNFTRAFKNYYGATPVNWRNISDNRAAEADSCLRKGNGIEK